MLTAGYTADFAEVAALGCDGCLARSSEQTEIAKFWEYSLPPIYYGAAVTGKLRARAVAGLAKSGVFGGSR